MKHRLSSVAAVTLAAAISALFIAAGPAQAQSCITVEVQNVRPDQGMLMIAAYGDAASFNKTPLVATMMRAGPETTIVPLCHLTGSSVALMLYQDLNGNGKLDLNVLGIPTEPWGASGKPTTMSAPTWETASVPLDGTTIVIKLSK